MLFRFLDRSYSFCFWVRELYSFTFVILKVFSRDPLISKFWRSQRCDFGIPSSYKYAVGFSGGCRLSHGDIFVEADISIQIIAKFTKVGSSGDLLKSWWRYSYSYKIFFLKLTSNGFIITLR